MWQRALTAKHRGRTCGESGCRAMASRPAAPDDPDHDQREDHGDQAEPHCHAGRHDEGLDAQRDQQGHHHHLRRPLATGPSPAQGSFQFGVVPRVHGGAVSRFGLPHGRCGYRRVVPQEVIPVVRVSDAARAVAWYERLGFLQEWEHRFEPGFPAFVSIARGHARIYLSEHEGDARPDTLIYLRHSELDEVAELLGATIEQQPWGRELETRDPDGNRLRIAEPMED